MVSINFETLLSVLSSASAGASSTIVAFFVRALAASFCCLIKTSGSLPSP